VSRRRPNLLAAALVLAGCGGEPGAPQAPAPPSAPPAPAPPQGRFLFTDIAKRAGITVPTPCGGKEKAHLLDSQGNGIALLDYDGDGRLDLFVPSGWVTEPGKVAARAPCRLYRNRGDGTFEDATERAGVGGDAWASGAAVGDVDGDGRPDLFVTCFGPDALYRNLGDGTFERVKDGPGIDGWSTGAAFFDADGDGDEDLYVAAYVDCTLRDVLDAKPTLDWNGAKVAFGPFGLKGKADAFFRNEGGGRWAEASKESGLEDLGSFYGFGVLAADLDRDGDVDVYVANDSNPNYLFRNEGGGKFREVGLWSGAGLSERGTSQAGMGVAAGDYDGDGLPDLFVTNFSRDTCTLYRNTGKGLFADVSAAAGVTPPTYLPLSWGCAFADFDLDGDEDLYVANGHIYPQADTAPASRETWRQRDLLLENRGGAFADATAEAGPGLAVVESSRGVAVGDLDGDGDLDVVVGHVDAPPSILRNDSPRRGSWLLVDAPAALRVEVEAGGRRQVRFRVRGGSFLSASDPRFHFGLGEAKSAASVRVVWPDGKESVLKDVAADRVIPVEKP
jgi:hypothetical protein